MIKSVDMVFEFKNTIARSPQDAKEQYAQACANDKVTIDHWREKWLANTKATKERFGSFKDRGVGKLFGSNALKPAIVCGAGPSLKNNITELAKIKNIPILSCLHNYHYMVDNGVDVKYYVSLDAGPVVTEEIFEGGKRTSKEYFESTKDKTLIAYIGSDPSLFEAWQGDVYLYGCPVADDEIRKKSLEIEPFYTLVSSGGNVLGAASYIAKAILGSNPLAFVGADFCFSYTRKFHAWDSKYDAKIGEAIRCVDVWGNSVLTWQSYYNFKVWFDWMAEHVPGIYINCTEGGLMGSYPEGNIQAIRQMALSDFALMYNIYEEKRAQSEKPDVEEFKVLF